MSKLLLSLFVFFVFFALISSVALKKKVKKSNSKNYCQHPGNLINRGRNLPLRVINTISDSTTNVPIFSNVEIDTVTKWQNWDAWCVTADIHIQSFTNGLCLNTADGKKVIANDEGCYLPWTKNQIDSQYVMYLVIINGKTLALTAHQNDNTITLEKPVKSANSQALAFQEWVLHLP